MSRTTTGILAVALATAAVTAAGGVAGATTSSTLSSPTTTRIAGNLLPSLAALPSVAAPAGQVLSIGVALAHPDTRGEQALQAALYDPKSPQFGRFPSFEQVAQRFGVPRNRTLDVVDTLRNAGLAVTTPDAMGDYVSATGTVAQVQRAFNVTERTYTLSNGTRFVANTTGPQVNPADGVITVVGLNTLQRYTLPAGHAKPAQNTCTQGTCLGSTTPQDLWSVYGQPATSTGTGVPLAVIGEGDPKNLTGYLRTHEATYGLPQAKVTINCVQSGDCGTDTSGDDEWQMDMQASAGMAPDNAGLTLYFAKSILDGDLNNSFLAWSHDDMGPKLASASLGECESSPANGLFTGPLGATNGNTSSGPQAVVAFGNGEQAAVDPILATAVLLGKTLFASSGDTGSSCPVIALPVIGAGNGVANQVVPEQNYPAVSVSAVGVGGTVLYTADNKTGAGKTYKPGAPATRKAEYTWTFGGGGASPYVPAPSWQHGVAGINLPCVTDPTSLCRGVPDVAAQSGDVATNGYSVVGSGGFTNGGGTSLSSPLWMGMWARVQGAAGTNLGFAAPALYRAASTPAGYAASFFDVTIGNNGLYNAGTGWDYTTGLGTPNVRGLITTLVGPILGSAGRTAS